ncbi:isochorismate synthase [Massilia sp. W12]|uniref:isochorismate synthase n=1 Tax=Massilia sp. W12 TaxID=3126507 RepID=UPI0030CFE929
MRTRLHTASALPEAGRLIAEYRRFASAQAQTDAASAQQALFISPSRSLLCQGVRASLALAAQDDLAQAAARLLQAQHDPHALLFGVLPFDNRELAHLRVPARTLQGRRLRHLAPLKNSAARREAHLLPQPAQQAHYQHAVRSAVQAITRGELHKVVLARSLDLQVRAAGFDLAAIVQGLAERNQAGYSWAIDLPQSPRRTLLAASPELVLARDGMQVRSHPLAGSIARAADPQEDHRRAAGLLASVKDLQEHAPVVQAIAETLRPYCKRLHVPATPQLVATPTMWHLGTLIEGELAAPVSSLELAIALHPTPAVCGVPRQAAADFLQAHEGFAREMYAGLCGWSDAQGNGEWALNLRCADMQRSTEHWRMRLYAGAGIVQGSEPEAEWLETEGKLRTLLRGLQMEYLLEQPGALAEAA